MGTASRLRVYDHFLHHRIVLVADVNMLHIENSNIYIFSIEKRTTQNSKGLEILVFFLPFLIVQMFWLTVMAVKVTKKSIERKWNLFGIHASAFPLVTLISHKGALLSNRRIWRSERNRRRISLFLLLVNQPMVSGLVQVYPDREKERKPTTIPSPLDVTAVYPSSQTLSHPRQHRKSCSQD